MTDLLDQAATIEGDVDAVEALLPTPQAAQDVAVRQQEQVPAVPGQAEPVAVLNALLALAKDPSLNIDVFDRLIALQERSEDRQAERAFNAAFVRMQAKLPVVKRDGKLEYDKTKGKPEDGKILVTKYARWEDIEKAIRPAYTSEGFSLSFQIAPRLVDGGGLMISAILRHEGGHKEIGDPMPVPLDTSGGKNNVQAYGSALSYGKRYAAFAALNIVTEGDDDDGVEAGNRTLTREEALEIKTLVAESEIDPKEWFGEKLDYPIKQYLDIRFEDLRWLKRALKSAKPQSDAEKKEMRL